MPLASEKNRNSSRVRLKASQLHRDNICTNNLQQKRIQDNGVSRKKDFPFDHPPDFVRLNRVFPRLGLTKVHDIQQYRKHHRSLLADTACHHRCERANTCPVDVTYGRPSGEKQSIRDLIEHKYSRD